LCNAKGALVVPKWKSACLWFGMIQKIVFKILWKILFNFVALETLLSPDQTKLVYLPSLHTSVL
jgi:hypothetical protein